MLGRAKEWAKQIKHTFLIGPSNLAAEIEIIFFRNVQSAREEALGGGLGMAVAGGLAIGTGGALSLLPLAMGIRG